MVLACVIFHVAGLVYLIDLMQSTQEKLGNQSRRIQAVVVLNVAVLVIICLHTIEIWLWALLYNELGEFESFSQALYFSGITATTVGYGDVTLSSDWQLLATFEAMGGLILFGASTAFFFELVRRMVGRPGNQ